MAIVYLALGSNLSDRKAMIQKAISHLNTQDIKILKISTIIETDPVGGPAQNKYLNAVLKAQTYFSAEDLLTITKAIEIKIGRIKKVVNGPRLIDIDILLYDDLKLVTRGLVIPHPRMMERSFVLKPLEEIEPRLCASFQPKADPPLAEKQL